MASSEAAEGSLEFTPTWIIAVVCSVIVFISLALERILHYIGKHLKKTNQKPLFEALQKVKEELMLLGFISLLLTVFQGPISHICIPKNIVTHMLPCEIPGKESASSTETSHYQVFSFSNLVGSKRRLLATAGNSNHCTLRGKVQLLSLEAIHQLHIFIFVLAIVHVIFSVLTMLLGGAKIRQWKHWEGSIPKDNMEGAVGVTDVQQHSFIREHSLGFARNSSILRWLFSFLKQFHASVTKSDYITLRLGFIMTHCRGNPKFNFYKYMMRALEADFKKVVGISWYLWIFVMIFLLLNVGGWHTYFWIAFIPLILLLAVGAKLEHVITKLAHDVVDKHTAIEGDLVVQPSDHYFWFHRPRLVLYLIHFILFQNAFEIAFFFWILTTYGFDSCIMGQVGFIIPRLIIGVIIQCLCSYSTLPLYAIVTQMGSSFKKAIFDEHVHESLVGWAQKVKKRKGFKPTKEGGDASSHTNRASGSPDGIQMQHVETESLLESGNANTGKALGPARTAS